MEKKNAFLTLTTDFGTKDPYVGSMKGAILTINPKAVLVDVTHEIRPGAVPQAAYFIRETYRHFPKGTIHIAVVDPGVGGTRRPMALEASGYVFVGPDNGIFWKVMEQEPSYRAYHLTNTSFFRQDISRTFHGRDIFGPAAAHISTGVRLELMGDEMVDPTPLRQGTPKRKGNALLGEVIRVDRFGNIITNISVADLRAFTSRPQEIQTEIGKLKLSGLKETYCDVDQGIPLVLIGSSGLLEIAVNQGNAAGLADISEHGEWVVVLRRPYRRTPSP